MMASAAADGVLSSLDRLDSALEALRRQWATTGIDYLSATIEKNYNDWRYLRILWESYGKGSHAAGLKIEATAEEIAQDLVCLCDGENEEHQKWAFQFKVVRDCDMKMKCLMAEIAEALDHLYLLWSTGKGRSSSTQLQLPFCAAYLDVSILSSFSRHLSLDVIRIRQTASDRWIYARYSSTRQMEISFLWREIELLCYFMGKLCDHPKFPSPGGAGVKIDHVPLPGIDACLGHLVSLHLRIASFCSDYNFGVVTGRDRIEGNELIRFIEDLRLHPRNPKTLELHLNFLTALYCNSSEHKVGAYFVGQYRSYLDREDEFLKEVRGLLDAIFYTTESHNKAVIQTFFPETNALVVEIASLREADRTGSKGAFNYQYQALSTKMALLRTEICLVQIQYRKFLSSILLGISDWYGITKFGKMTETSSSDYKKLPNEKREILEKMAAFTHSVFKEIESLRRSLALKGKEVAVKNWLLKLAFKATILREESFLMEFLLLNGSDNTTLLACVRDQITLPLEKLKYFLEILSDERMKDREDVIKALLQALLILRRMTCFSSSSLASPDKTVSPFLEQLDKATRSMEPKLREITPHFPVLDFPKTNNLKFLDFQLRNLRELLIRDPTSIASVKHKIEEILQHFKSLSSFLISVFELDLEKLAGLKDLANRVIESGYKVEYVVGKLEVDAEWQDFFLLDNVLEELRQLDEKACGTHVPSSDVEVQDSKIVTRGSLGELLSRGGKQLADETLVDLNDQEQLIIQQLTGGLPKGLDVISVVGMPGLGKTTLARKVYNSNKVMSYFDHRAWCTVSQTYDKRALLLQILTCIIELTDEIRRRSDEDLESKLRQCLLKNKYLMVIDDIWGIGAWNDLKNAFPNNSNGSRILLTSRLHGLASQIKPDTVPHPLRPFSDEESWQLLEKKVFKEERCPMELLKVGKEIARLCQGLPLAVVAVAGILKTTEKSQSSWRKIAETLCSEIIGKPEAQCKEILELSYKHLTEDLKPCFLYLGVFNEDKDILVSKLIRFWLAEGFIPEVESRIAEDLAEDFLMDLIGRSLVMISTRRSNGKVKSCRLHDLVLDFCKSKGEEENFFQLVTKSSIPYASYPSSDYGFEFEFYHHLQPVVFVSYRLAISLKRNHFHKSRPSGLGTKSLVFFAAGDSEPKWPYDIAFLWYTFSLLRVLDFECINAISFRDEIGNLVLLRCLAVGGYMESIPESIANLRNLETLIVKGLRGKVILPYTIWNMTSLRHLHVRIHIALGSDHKGLGGCYELENLVSFSCLSLSCGEDLDWIIKRFPNLRNLSSIFFESQDSFVKCNQFPKLSLLTHLESLKIIYYGNPLKNGEFNLPLNLKELTLSMFGLPWSRISAIGCLPNLEVLKLLSGAFLGQAWDMTDYEFQKLRFLGLQNLDIVEWYASYDHLPKLERLVLKNCEALKKIPDDFASIDTLEIIEVHWCQQSVEDSAIDIQKETPEIKVLIRTSYSRSSA